MYVTISHLEMWFKENSFIQTCNEAKQCFHSYTISYFAGILGKDPNLWNLNGTEILFKTHVVMLLDYELLLWNRKHVVFITNYNHLVKLFYKFIVFHILDWPDMFYWHFLSTFLIRWNIDLESSCLFQFRTLNEGKIWGPALLKMLFASYMSTNVAQLWPRF